MLMKAMEHSGKIMQFYNLNQIQRMKIIKGEFEMHKSYTDKPEDFIKQVIEPFSHTLKNRSINVQIFRKNNSVMKLLKLMADWKNFQLVMFNIIQNAIKYNNWKGDLTIMLEVK